MQFAIRRSIKSLLVLTAALLAGLAVCAPAHRQSSSRALVIGINAYPKLGLSPLSGAENDADSMKELAGLVAGYDVKLLRGPEAKLEEVKNWMADVLDDPVAKKILVYFSGYGSVARNTDKESSYALVPSLVLSDSNKDDSHRDLPLSLLEEWAHHLSETHRSLTVIVDTAYTKDPTATKDFEAWQWKATSKCFQRDKTLDIHSVRPDVWIGDGTCLGATQTIGGAYEVVSSLDVWHGVFTETMIEWVEPEMVAHDKPTARDVVRQISLVLNPVVGNSYLKGEHAVGYPRVGPRLDDFFLTNQVSASGLPSGMERIAQQTKKLQGRFRIALDADNEHRPQLSALAQKLQAAGTDVLIVDRFQLPDRVIELRTDPAHPTLDLHLQCGEDAALDDLNDFNSASDWPAFQDRLMKAWYGLALFRSAKDRDRNMPADGQAKTGWIVQPDAPVYDLNGKVSLQITSTQAGALLVFYRDDSDGFVDDWFPVIEDPQANIVEQGSYTTRPFMKFASESTETRTELACYFIAPSLLTPNLPKLDPDKQRAEFNAQMVKLLHDVWDAVQAGKPGWASCVTSYAFKKS